MEKIRQIQFLRGESETLTTETRSFAASNDSEPYDIDAAVDDMLLNGLDDDTEEQHSFAADHSGEALVASKKNPRVKRWMRVQALKNRSAVGRHMFVHKDLGVKGSIAVGVGGVVGSVASKVAGANLSDTASERASREAVHQTLNVEGKKIWEGRGREAAAKTREDYEARKKTHENRGAALSIAGEALSFTPMLLADKNITEHVQNYDNPDHPGSPKHYLKHHKEAVNDIAKRTGVGRTVAAEAMAHYGSKYHVLSQAKHKPTLNRMNGRSAGETAVAHMQEELKKRGV